MIRAWIKSKLPRSLFGRAMLILAVPIIVIQIVVAIFFAERLFRDVSEQMSSNIALEINHIINQANTASDKDASLSTIKATADPLKINTSYGKSKPATVVNWQRFDLSGRYVAKALFLHIDTIKYVDLAKDKKRVYIGAETNHGLLQLSFDRARVSAKNPHQLLVAMLLTSLIFTAISILFLNNQIRPIKRLSDAAEAFGRGWSIPFNPRGAREVRSAGHSFLAMRARIVRQIEQRTMMLSGVSHDLRTPLTRMKLSLDLLEPSEELEYLKRDVKEMETMLTEFLDFARGDSEESPENIGVKQLCERITRNFLRLEHNVELVFTNGDLKNTQFKGREHALQRAIENLIGNATRYATHARLTVDIRPNRIKFIIEDDGPGIPEEKRQSALEPFSRLDISRNQDQGLGSGLGLAITADIARSHGGKLELSDSQDMGGLKATLSLPR